MELYAIWIKIDETLPWIELKGTYQTRKQAQKAAEEFLKAIRVKTVKVGVEHKPIKAVVTVKR